MCPILKKGHAGKRSHDFKEVTKMKRLLDKIVWPVLVFCVFFELALAQSPPNTITFDNQSGELAVVKLMETTNSLRNESASSWARSLSWGENTI